MILNIPDYETVEYGREIPLTWNYMGNDIFGVIVLNTIDGELNAKLVMPDVVMDNEVLGPIVTELLAGESIMWKFVYTVTDDSIVSAEITPTDPEDQVFTG